MEKHPIDRLFEEKLKDFAEMPATNLWERIEKQIPHQKEQDKGFFRRFWWVLLLLLPMGASIRYVQYTKHETNAQKVEKNTNQMPQTAQIVENTQSVGETSETLLEGNTTERIQENAIQQPVNEKNEKNIKTDATPAEQNASSNQKVEEREKTTEEPTEKIVEKDKENTTPIKENTNKNTDTIKNNATKKGVKVIIKLSEPEEPKEGKARDFASTKAGKFLKKAKRIKEGETKIPPLTITLNY